MEGTNTEVINELLKIIHVVVLLITGGWISYITTKLIDSYMNYGEILDFVRLRIAKFFNSKLEGKTVLFSEIENSQLEDYETDYPYFERQQQMSKAYWDLAFHSKAFKLFICPDCMSVYISILVAFGFSYMLGFTILKVVLFWFFNVIISYQFLNWKSE